MADDSIFVLIEEEEIEAIEDLIASGKADVNQKDEVRWSPPVNLNPIAFFGCFLMYY